MPTIPKPTQEAIDKARQLTGDPIQFAVLAEDGSILFAGPLPPKYGNLPYPKIEDGKIIMTDIEFELWEDAWSDYLDDQIRKAERQAHPKRTRTQAREAGAIVDLSGRLALPSRRHYEDILSTIPNPMGYLLPVRPELAADLRLMGETLYFRSQEVDRTVLAELCDKTAKPDMPLLYALYTVLQQETMKMITRPGIIDDLLKDPNYLDRDVTVFLPAFIRITGHRQNRSKDVDDGIFAKIKSFESIYGIVEEIREGKTCYRGHPVLRLRPRNVSDNSITFSSRYMKEAVLRILKASLQYDKADKKETTPKTKRGGEPFFYPNHCFLVNSSIAAERNKRAAAIVCEFAVVVAQAGSKGKPNLSGQELVNRCPELKNALDAAKKTKDKNNALKSAFSRAWELLGTQTAIAEEYKEVVFPTKIPTMSTLENNILIQHKGRNRKDEKQDE